MLRILHTSDWHLGHMLRGFSRDTEHAAFLEWLLQTVECEAVDALLVAGDIFHTANPSATAQQMFYDFIGSMRERAPNVDVVVIGGNHDAASRLDAPASIYRHAGVRVVGGYCVGRHEPSRALAPVTAADGSRGWVAAVPFLRPSDFDPQVFRDDGPTAAFRHAYDQVIGEALQARDPDEPIIAMGHCFMSGGQTSEDSERDVIRGGEEALPVDVFGPEVEYVALGHLHLAQSVGDLEHVRYCGSPIPLSMTEAEYRHQVLIADFDGPQLHGVRSVLVEPRASMIRVGKDKPARLEATLATLADMDLLERSVDERPFLDVTVLVDGTESELAVRIRAAVNALPVRFVGIHRVTAYDPGGGLADALPGQHLQDLKPSDVFARLHERERGCEPDDALRQTFRELEDSLASEDWDQVA